MWSQNPLFDLIVETLTGSEIEVTVSQSDTIACIKSKIQQFEGIPINQQHLLYNHKELTDTTTLKDIPLVNGSRLKLVLGMRGGPVSARRVVSLQDYDNLFDISDVFQSRQDPISFKSSGVKLLLYKDCKKNIRRVVKLRGEKSDSLLKNLQPNRERNSCDENNAQWVKDNQNTMEKMNQLRMQMDRKKDKNYRGNDDDGFPSDSDMLHNSFTNMSNYEDGVTTNSSMSTLLNDAEIEAKFKQDILDEFIFQQQDLEQQQHQQALLGTIGCSSKKMAKPKFSVFFDNNNNTNNNGNGNPNNSQGQCAATNSSTGFCGGNNGIKSPANVMSSSSAIELENKLNRMKIRENVQRNRSFKTINFNHGSSGGSSPCSSGGNSPNGGRDFILESVGPVTRFSRSLSFQSNNIISRAESLRKCYNNNSNNSDMKLSSSSVHDIIEILKYNPTRLRTISNDAINKIVSATKQQQKTSFEQLQPQQAGMATATATGGAGAKDIDEYIREYDIQINTRINNTPRLSTSNDFIDIASTTGGGGLQGYIGGTGDRQHFLMNRDKRKCSGEISFENGGTGLGASGGNGGGGGGSLMENSFRLYKTSSDDNNCYELSKLLIREDSPVESFHSSDPQLESLALAHSSGGESPKLLDNSSNPFSNVDAATVTADLQASIAPPSLITNNKTSNASSTSQFLLDDCALDKSSTNPSILELKNLLNNNNGTNINSGGHLHHHHHHHHHHLHHSDLGLNELDLKFLNNDISHSNIGVDGGLLKKNCSTNYQFVSSNLEISDWNNFSAEFNGTTSDGANKNGLLMNGNVDSNSSSNEHIKRSLNFINSELSLSSDEDDLFNGCDLIHKNCQRAANNIKSKSIDLNEFRKTFGSSPTLMNHTTTANASASLLGGGCGGGVVGGSGSGLLGSAQLPRLDAIPSQYRRGYANLNDACLSSSTSELECLNQNNVKNKMCGSKTSELSPLLKHRNNERLEYVRSYENLDRCKAFRIKNDTKCSNHHHHHHNHSHPSSSKMASSQNGSNSAQKLTGFGKNDMLGDSNFCLDDSFSDDSSLFDMNMDNYFDNFVEVEIKNFSDRKDSQPSSAKTTTSPHQMATVSSSAASTTRNVSELIKHFKSNSTTLLLPDINEKLLASTSNQEHGLDSGMSTCSRTDESLGNNGQQMTAKPQKLRCAKCNKKLGLVMIMKCHCEKLFCAQHRYAEAHNCSFNFKNEGKKFLARENPLVVAQKLPKI